MMFLQYLGYFCTLAMVGVIGYASWHDRRDTAQRARKEALTEAQDALKSLADIAGDATCDLSLSKEELSARFVRQYHYHRAYQIVASIPVDRV